MAPRRLPSFVKFLLHPSAPHLPFPHAFVRRHLENKIPEDPVLLSVNGGYSWSLKIRRTGESYCFADGWINVVEEGHLGFGDFLVFWLVDQSTFKLSVFSPNGCEKHFPPKIHVTDDDDEEKEEEEDEDDGDIFGVGDEEEDDEDDGDSDYFGGGDEEEDEDDGDQFGGGDEEEDEDDGNVNHFGGGDEEEQDEDDGDVNHFGGGDEEEEDEDDGNVNHFGGGDEEEDDEDDGNVNHFGGGDEEEEDEDDGDGDYFGGGDEEEEDEDDGDGDQFGGGDEEEEDEDDGNVDQFGGGDEEEEDEDDGNVDQFGGGDEADQDDDGSGCDPSFTKIISKENYMRLPLKFVRSTGMDVEKMIAMKNLDGMEWQMSLLLERCSRYTRYLLSAGWCNFRRVNKLSEGDECLFKFIRSENKLCLAKVTKKALRPKQPAPAVRRKKLFSSKIGIKHKEEDDDGGVDSDGDPFFRKIISKRSIMRVPVKFVRLAGIDQERIITMKNLDGKEWQMRCLPEKCRHYSRYILSTGWFNFRRGNELSEGDKCVFKFIRSEDKLCMVKVTKKTVPASQPAGKLPSVEVSKRTRGRPPRVEMESKDNGLHVMKRPRGRPKQSASKVPAVEVPKRPRGRPPRVESKENGLEVMKRPRGRPKQSASKVPVVEVPKRARGRPPRVEVENKDHSLEVMKRPRGRPKQSASKVPVVEVPKRARGRPPRVEVENKDHSLEVMKRPRGRPKQTDNKVQVVEVPKRARGRPPRVEVESKDAAGAEAMKRPRGRPPKRKRGRPRGV